jgi:hypothetical protein
MNAALMVFKAPLPLQKKVSLLINDGYGFLALDMHEM